MKLFELRVAGPTAGDCTTPYYVEFYGECTVREFINEVVKQNECEWGYVIIGSYYDGPRIEYTYGKIVSSVFSQDILDAKIKNATASGGWTRMDYLLDIWTDEQKPIEPKVEYDAEDDLHWCACGKCGKKIDWEDKFCKYCGHEVKCDG